MVEAREELGGADAAPSAMGSPRRDRAASGRVNRFASLSWSLAPFANVARLRHMASGRHGAEYRRYPFRYLRYWFMYHYLDTLHARLGRPLEVCEIGPQNGQALAFMGGPAETPERYRLPDMVARWDGIDVFVQEDDLRSFGYTSYKSYNVEKTWDLEPESYDAIIFLHVLEHFFEPERVLAQAARSLRPGGILIGGAPTMPHWMAGHYERYIRPVARPYKHVSVISPTRARRAAEKLGLRLDHLSGAFAARASGRRIEDSALWLRVNVAFGGVLPHIGSEVYFMLTKV